MKLNEPTITELSRYYRQQKSKTYVDYLNESEYNKSYKKFCVSHYINSVRSNEYGISQENGI